MTMQNRSFEYDKQSCGNLHLYSLLKIPF